jgi:minor extracellular serine protease Vpr
VDRRTPTRRSILSALAAAAVLLLAACGGMGATPDAGLPDGRDDRPTAAGTTERATPLFDPFTGASGGNLTAEPSVWFVAVDAPALVDGGARDAVAAAVDAVHAAASDAGVAFTPRYVFDTFVSGFSVAADAGALQAIAALPGVRAISPVGIVPGPQVERHGGPAVPQLITAIAMTGADVVQNEYGFDGAGVRVGIIDTGILAAHPDFGGRVVAGYDFVGDLYDAGDPANATPVPEPGDFTRPGGGDCNGHGTHVAGIVGAGGPGVVGVAPGVDLGAYRVFGCEGSSNSDVILAAIERAYADGMDVVNLSLGSNNGFADDFLAIALGRMAELGMVPVASAGNNGGSGTFTIGSPGAGADVLTVASVDNTDFPVPSFLVDGNAVG